jgi:hypothetical protein
VQLDPDQIAELGQLDGVERGDLHGCASLTCSRWRPLASLSIERETSCGSSQGATRCTDEPSL